MDELVDLVDGDDNIVGVRPRRELVDGTDRWRIVVLMVKATDGERVLLAKRSYGKLHDPGRWAPPVAGTVAAGETYGDAVEREAYEELGLQVRAEALRVAYRGPLDAPGQLRYATVYELSADLDVDDVRFDPDETQALAWVVLAEARLGLECTPERYVPQLGRILAMSS